MLAALNFGALHRFRSLYGYENEPIQVDAILVLLVGVGLVAASLSSARRTSIALWIAAGLWLALTAVAVAVPEVLGEGIIRDGLQIVGMHGWFAVLALVAVMTGVAAMPRKSRH